MSLFRFLPAALLVVGVLPCAAQTAPPLSSGVVGMEGSPCIAALGPKFPGRAAVPKKPCVESKKSKASAMKPFMAEKNSACYAIRDYEFANSEGLRSSEAEALLDVRAGGSV